MTPKKIHFGVLVASHCAEVHEMDMPDLGPEDVLLKQKTCNLCTMDYQQWMGLRDHQGYPYAGGHEYAGVIVAKGKNVIDEYKEGDLVVACSGFCGKCNACRKGLTMQCAVNQKKRQQEPQPDENGYYGSMYGFADYKVIDQNRIIKMGNVSPAVAAFVEPCSSICQANRRANVQMGDDVVVIGAGSQGLNHAQVAKAFGARVMISEILPHKLERARKLGFADVIDTKNTDPVAAVKELTNGKGADVVMMAVGTSSLAYKQGYDMLKRSFGKFVIYPAGYPKPELAFDLNEIHYRNIEIYGSYGMDIIDWLKAAELISSKRIDPSHSLEGKFFPLEDIQKAFEAASTPGAYRIQMTL